MSRVIEDESLAQHEATTTQERSGRNRQGQMKSAIKNISQNKMSDEQFSSNQACQTSTTSYSKQGLEIGHPSYCSFGSVPMNTEISPVNGFNDPYNVYFQSNSIQCTHQNCVIENFHQFNNNDNWDNKVLAMSDEKTKQIDSVELISKEFSPTNYSGSTDIYSLDSNYQWYYSNGFAFSHNQKSVDTDDLPSCAKVAKLRQKKNCACKISETVSNELLNVANDRDILHNTKSINCQYNLCYYDKIQSINGSYVSNAACNSSVPFESLENPIDQQTECSNEESDIIVEESDEDQIDCSEEQETLQINKCLLCNAIYKALGIQFFYLTPRTPLTMSTQTPVLFKLSHIVGDFKFSKTYLCCECLGLLNAFDNLQFKLENIRREIVERFERTCIENNVRYSQTKDQNLNITRKNTLKLVQYKCKVCLKVLPLKKYLFYHLRSHKNRGYLCEICGNKSHSKRKFLFHRNKHMKKPALKISSFKCSSCDKIFRTKSNKKEHENFCLGIFPYECRNQSCDKKFASATKLKNHIKLKHDKKFIAICSICNIGFVKVSDYKSHMITHSTDKKYSCKVCDKSYKTLSNLNFHMKMHDDKLPFICTICNKGFMRKEYLDAHVNNHNGIKKFKCTICDKQFVSQKNLDSHLKYHEGTVKTKTCNICGKTMATGYEEHLRIHNNLREFECDLCDFRFNTKGALSKHRKKKHSEKNQENILKVDDI